MVWMDLPIRRRGRLEVDAARQVHCPRRQLAEVDVERCFACGWLKQASLGAEPPVVECAYPSLCAGPERNLA